MNDFKKIKEISEKNRDIENADLLIKFMTELLIEKYGQQPWGNVIKQTYQTYKDKCYNTKEKNIDLTRLFVNDLMLGDFDETWEKVLKFVDEHEKEERKRNPNFRPEVQIRKQLDIFAHDIGLVLKGSEELFYRYKDEEIVEIKDIFDKDLNQKITVFSNISQKRFINIISNKCLTYVYNAQSEKIYTSISKNVAEIIMCSDFIINSLYKIKRFLKFPLPFIINNELIIPQKGYDERFEAYFTADTPDINLISIDDAKQLLNKILSGFCFKDEIDKVIAVAYLLTPACRGLYSRRTARTPLFLIKANRERAGKDYLAGVQGIIYEGKAIDDSPISDSSMNQNNDELRKKITSGLIQGRRRFHSSNNKGFMNNSVFEQVLTSETIRDRILGKSKETELDNELDFSLSANWGLTYTPDLWFRSRPINLFFSEEDPNNREFEIEDLHGFVFENRPKIISAIMTLINDWVQNGMPSGKSNFTSFPEWARVVGGIMQHHDLGDPCVQLEDDGVGGDKSTDDMKKLFELLYTESKTTLKKAWTSPEMMDYIINKQDEYGIFIKLDLTQRKGRTSFGMQLTKFIGREMSGIKLVVDNSNKKKSQWYYMFVKEKDLQQGNVQTKLEQEPKKEINYHKDKIIQADEEVMIDQFDERCQTHIPCSVCGEMPTNEYKKIYYCKEHFEQIQRDEIQNK